MVSNRMMPLKTARANSKDNIVVIPQIMPQSTKAATNGKNKPPLLM